jgi:hypothetical protein
MDQFRLNRVRDRLLAEAALCERIGAATFDEDVARRCKQAAHEARTEAAALASQAAASLARR